MIRVAQLWQRAFPLAMAAMLATGAPLAGTAAAGGTAAPAALAQGEASPVGSSPPPAEASTPNPPAPPVGSPAPSAAAASPAAAAQRPAAPAPPANLEALTARDCTGILGKKIMGPDGKELGLLVDVLVDAKGRPHAAVIDFGGFLGVGSRKIAVDWRLLKLEPGPPDWKISLNLNRAEIQGAPEYKPDETSAKMVGPPPSPAPALDTGR
jgi:hypothetical protein